ncbi:MAG: hypothetical protein V4659_01390 [Pseudomonadota bacterium]
MMRPAFLMSAALALALALALAAAAPATAQQQPTPLFAADAPIAVTIRGPIGAVIGNRDGGGAGQPATLTLAGAAESHAIRLSPRGITRRRKETCQFPPLRVDFAAPPAAGMLFAGQRRLKLVTHCRQSEAFQQYLLLEYAAYRLFNTLTPLSFRVRLATVDYLAADGKPVIRRAGFFIEDIADVAARNGRERARTPDRFPIGNVARAEAARVAVFNYAISNLDFSLNAGPPGEGCCHNARLVSGTGAGLIPIPYDFDFAGFVDAPYAVPPNSVAVANVRVRRYRGHCRYNAEAVAAAAALIARRADLLGVLATIPGLDERSRAKAGAFLDASLDRLADPAEVFKTCLAG